MKDSTNIIHNRMKDESIKFLLRLIQADSSISEMGRLGNEIAVQEIIIETLESLGAKIDIFEPDNQVMKNHPEYNPNHNYSNRPNVVGTIKGTGGGKSLIINSHADVVPAGNSSKWISPPFKPVIINGKIYGRGACDMKAGGAAALMALKTLKANNIRLRGDIIFESVVDEEGGGNGTLACCIKGYHADAAIIPEPTELKLMPAHMGWMFYRVEFYGRPIHCAFKWNGVNAIEKCLHFMNCMQDLERNWAIVKHHPYLPAPTICFTVINGGDSSSTVPEKCILDMSVHFHPCESVDDRVGEKIENELMHAINNFIASDDWLRDNPIKIDKFQLGNGYDIGSDHAIVQCAADSIKLLTGSCGIISGLACGADARLINNYANTPTLLFGPGSISNAHSINEFVEESEYLLSIKLYTDIILRWCGLSE